MRALRAFFEAKRKLKALTPAQQELYSSRSAKGTRTLDEWFGLLEPVAAVDIDADAFRQGRAGLVFFTSAPALILTVILSLIMNMPVFLLGIVIIVGILLFAFRSQIGSHDLANGLREIVIPFLKILREEIPADGRVTLELDLAPVTDKSKRVSEEKVSFNVTRSLHANRWFSGAAMTAEKVGLKWSLKDTAKIKSKQKRKGIRRRIRVFRDIVVRVSFPKKTFGAIPNPGHPGVEIQDGPVRTTLKLAGSFVPPSGALGSALTPDDKLMPLLRLIGAAYHYATGDVSQPVPGAVQTPAEPAAAS